ncbi:MAG: hypothetical protein QM773_08210 [Hyphomonadaceae bacterium]
MDWLSWLFSDPFDHGHSMLTYLLLVLAACIVVAFWLRRMEWSGAAWLAVLVTTAIFLLIYGVFHAIGPMFLVGFVTLGLCGGVVAGPIVGLIRHWMARKT